MDYFSTKISIDNQDLEVLGLQKYLISVEIYQEHCKCDMAILTFWNQQLRFTDSNIFRERAAIDIFIGDGEVTSYLDRFVLQKPKFIFSGTRVPIIRLVAFNEAILLKENGQKRRSFINITDSEIATQLAAENGLLVDATTTNIRRDSEKQINETDLKFLSRLANRNGFILFVEKKVLHFHPVRFNQSLTQLEYGTGERNLRSFEVDKTLIDKGGTFKATFLDKLTGAMQTVFSTDIPDAIKTQDIKANPDYRDAQQIFLQRPSKFIVGLDSEDNVVSQQQAIDRHQQENQYLVGGWGKASLIPNLKARQIIPLKGLGHLSGNYYIQKLIHKIDKEKGGGTTSFFGIKSRIGILKQTITPGAQGPKVTNNPAKDIQPNVISEVSL